MFKRCISQPPLVASRSRQERPMTDEPKRLYIVIHNAGAAGSIKHFGYFTVPQYISQFSCFSVVDRG